MKHNPIVTFTTLLEAENAILLLIFLLVIFFIMVILVRLFICAL